MSQTKARYLHFLGNLKGVSVDFDLRQSADGSFSAYNKDFSQCYHSLQCGALSESLYKHIVPTFLIQAHKDTYIQSQNQPNNSTMQNNCASTLTRVPKNFDDFFKTHLSHITYTNTKKELAILDICFGLGYNTFGSIYFYTLLGFPCKLKIYTPEIDEKMLKNLHCFPYPKEFENLAIPEIMHDLLTKQKYNTPNSSIELFIGEAHSYIKTLPTQSIDIIYHDAFSPKENPSLWNVEFFGDLRTLLQNDGILSTYSQSRAIRENALSQGFLVYDCKAKWCNIRAGSLMSKQNLNNSSLITQFYRLKPVYPKTLQ